MTIKEIAKRRFSRAFRGYDISEVDTFLDEIIKDMERTEQDIKILQLRNQVLLERLAKHGISLDE